MKLVVTRPGQVATEIEGPLKQLMGHARRLLAYEGLSPEEEQKHIYSLSFEMHRVRGTNVIDGDGNLIASYRITR